jgi:hypothetical protein
MEVVKMQLAGMFKDMILVLAGSYGSLDPMKQTGRAGTPIDFPKELITGLYDSDPDLPGLKPSKEEFDEMIAESVLEIAADEIWEFCDAHIGVASNILNELYNNVKGFQGGLEALKTYILSKLYSDKIMTHVFNRRPEIT